MCCCLMDEWLCCIHYEHDDGYYKQTEENIKRKAVALHKHVYSLQSVPSAIG